MIGDASPHPPSYHLNTLKIDWREEAKKLYNEMGVRIYSVQCLNYGGSDTFYRKLADLSCGWHLKLDQFSSIVDFLTAICYREQGVEHLEAFEAEVKGRSKGSSLNRNLHALFDTLAGRSKSTYTGGGDWGGLVPVNPSRFQVGDVKTLFSGLQYVTERKVARRIFLGRYHRYPVFGFSRNIVARKIIVACCLV